MRKLLVLLAIAVLATVALPAFAELQNVEIGGSIWIRGNYISNTFTAPMPAQLRYGPLRVLGRPIGGPFNPVVASIFDWDDRGGNLKFVEERTILNVKADFTDNVKAVVALDSYDVWGEDFRSNYLTGVDARANSGDDVEVYQAYVEANEMFGYPVRLRVGRQELAFGNQWLVGTRDFEFYFSGLSFDGVRLSYSADKLTIDGWWSKLAERSPIEEDGDVDFYGVYATYAACDACSLDAYWMYVRDARSVQDTPGNNFWEQLWGLDDYGVTNLHTVGLRAAGKVNAFDYNAEVAYQFGDASQIGATFKPFLYGVDDADFDTWGATAEVGYSFDCKCKPRVFLSGTYFGGEDNRDLSFWEWLNPFDRPEASVSFNRLFSNVLYSGFMDLWNDTSNVYMLKAGAMGGVTEKLMAIVAVTYFGAVEPFDRPVVPILTFWTEENDSYLGTEADLFLRYQYSEDLRFEAGWCHLFVGDGLEEGSFSRWNGLIFNGGSDDDDADYFYIGSKLNF
jgi:hypothetical protein